MRNAERMEEYLTWVVHQARAPTLAMALTADYTDNTDIPRFAQRPPLSIREIRAIRGHSLPWSLEIPCWLLDIQPLPCPHANIMAPYRRAGR